MSSSLHRALKQIEEMPSDEKRLGHAASESLMNVDSERLVNAAERRLGVIFPAEYRTFLKEFGWGGPDGTEVWGISSKFPETDYPSVVRKNAEARNKDGLPHNLLAFETTGDGGYYVFKLNSSTENDLFVWYHNGGRLDEPQRADQTFGEWLLRAVEDAITLRDI